MLTIQNCKIPIYLAYAMTAYSIASMLYFIATRNIGTPLRDSYTSEQIMIKKESSHIRGKIFYISLGVAISILILIKPFKTCLPN